MLFLSLNRIETGICYYSLNSAQHLFDQNPHREPFFFVLLLLEANDINVSTVKEMSC
ncbi:hypothetical protein BD560DRAFT_392331 [Blakeslea trispora]|nr:hypothetical protein BD560DRAFT_392331 [Blakeslea trispora]